VAGLRLWYVMTFVLILMASARVIELKHRRASRTHPAQLLDNPDNRCGLRAGSFGNYSDRAREVCITLAQGHIDVLPFSPVLYVTSRRSRGRVVISACRHNPESAF
jgi:hypothetical protein